LRSVLRFLGLAALALGAQAEGPSTTSIPLTLDDIYSQPSIPDTAISPSGRYLAAILRRNGIDVLMVIDLQQKTDKVIARADQKSLGEKLNVHMDWVWWKSDDRLLVRLTSRVSDNARHNPLSNHRINRLGDRLVAIDRDGGNSVQLLVAQSGSPLEGASDLGDIASYLPHDPEHILLYVESYSGYGVYKVNLSTGRGEIVEKPASNVVDWWLDLDGRPVVRVETSRGTMRFYRRHAGTGDDPEWKQYLSVRLRELDEHPEYQPVGASDDPGKYYVISRPPGKDRFGLYLYDLDQESFGEPVYEHPRFDLESARVSRDGKRVIQYCYVAHVSICEFTDPAINTHMTGIRRHFKDTANVEAFDGARDSSALLLFVEGPSDPPAYYYYRTAQRTLDRLGLKYASMAGKAMPTATVIEWKSSDGLELTGYLTIPPGASDSEKLPLLVFPHGGPEERDQLEFDAWIQYFAARGYAVFQPNFRGSSGFGRGFAESGYRERGRKVQDDITTGVRALISRGRVDPARLCIGGISFGGYSALMGAASTPELYKCAVSIAGASDLVRFTEWRRDQWGLDSLGYKYTLKAIGNPKTEPAWLNEVSPAQLAANIRIPILLVHGTEDSVVPYEQGRYMKIRLDRAGRDSRLITLRDEGHSQWKLENRLSVVQEIDAFLREHLGPGFSNGTR